LPVRPSQQRLAIDRSHSYVSAMSVIEAIRWSDDGRAVRILDQRRLPGAEVYRDLRSVDDIRDAIATLAVRGAPAIGIAGAMGMVIAIDEAMREGHDPLSHLRIAHEIIRSARPTAVNLAWAVDRVLDVAETKSWKDLRTVVCGEATRILEEDRAMCRRIGEHGAELIPDGANIITHCNAGALATGGIGTALAAIYVAVEQGKKVSVYADETRPLLQGSRLTAWELERAGIPVTVLVDSAAASLMRETKIDLCIVGADRIAANGDVANKVGTFPLALSAKHHGVPFYVAAPTSTLDPATKSGKEILIEQRDRNEVCSPFDMPTAPDGVGVYNPAFDVTPADLITAIITDRAVVRAPFHFAVGT
jgi:methylthioribose-1-phosphate isomerase